MKGYVPPSLFPHKVRRQSVVTFLCIWRHRREEHPKLALLPRDTVRMICGWVKTDFTGVLIDKKGRRWIMTSHRDDIAGVPHVILEWKCQVPTKVLGVNPCVVCLSFLYASRYGEKEWKCQHPLTCTPEEYPYRNLKVLEKKYILPQWKWLG